MPSPTEQPHPSSDPPDSIAENAGRGQLSFLTRLLATGFFSGYSPVASGTTGSLIGLAVYALPGFENPWVLACSIVAVFFVGIRVAGAMERVFGHDPAQVTIDEIVGMWIALLALPKSLALAAGAFLLFRIFDIIKPFPARKFDDMKGGWGIMMDDVIAGVYANAVLRLLVWTGVFPAGPS